MPNKKKNRLSAGERHRIKTQAKYWTAWRQMEITDVMRETHPHLKRAAKIWFNSRCEAVQYNLSSGIGGVVLLTVSRHGQLEEPSRTDLYMTKIDLFGEENDAVEIYPKGKFVPSRSRVLLVLPLGYDLPYAIEKLKEIE